MQRTILIKGSRAQGLKGSRAQGIEGLKDVVVKRKVLVRLDRLKNNNFGNFKRIDSNLFELRFFFGSGLRIYYTMRSKQIILLLVGGDKSSQSKDIKQAKQILDELTE